MMKRKVTACLLAGVLVLAVSAGAAFDSINGYATYKNGVKKLLLQTDNVTLHGSYSATIDGKEMARAELDAATDGVNTSTHENSQEGQRSYEDWTYTCDGQYVRYNREMKAEKTYNGWEVETEPRGSFFHIDDDDELEQRMITFLELAADTVMGDLKNNFVSLGKEDGVTRYQVNISKEQVPAVINAGLSLLAYNESEYGGYISAVQYDDRDASFAVYYQEQTGTPIPQELLDNYWDGGDEEWFEANQEQIDAFEELLSQYSEENWEMLEAKGGEGVLLIHADNSSTYYADAQDYYEATDQVNLERYVGKEAALDNVRCTFGVDGQGNLMENNLTATFTSVDKKGQSHTLVVTAGFTASDYGTTAIQLPDLSGWTNVYGYQPTAESSEVTEVFED